WPHSVWINPVPERFWDRTRTITLIRRIFDGRMVPMTLDGLGRAMREVAR
ncbi:MAG: VWA domain-containing protein, partial [Rhodobacter sp.]|nr:VWA domain-containing protein [Rhodobacter sp.]